MVQFDHFNDYETELENSINNNNNELENLNKTKDYEVFLNKYHRLKPKENDAADKPNVNSSSCSGSMSLIESKEMDLTNTLSSLISCVGCRTSVERFYKKLIYSSQLKQSKFSTSSSYLPLDPFIIKQNGNITVKKSLLANPELVYKLFYMNR